jgi:type 1 glutamine amidotransferase
MTYRIDLTDGRTLVGVPRDAGGGKLIIGDAAGNEVTIARARVKSMTAAPVSLMPEGIDNLLGPAKMRDLLTYLLTAPPLPAPLERPGAPAPRTRAEVAAVLAGGKVEEKPGRTLRILLAAGPKDHGPGEHDYPLWQRRWFELLSLADGVRVESAGPWPTAAQWKWADVVVMYSANPSWDAGRGKELDAFLGRGGGLVLLHWAVNGKAAVDEYTARVGLAFRAGTSRFRHGALELTFPDSKHPITRGFGKVKFLDESYWKLGGDRKRITVLATGVEEKEAWPLFWARQQGKGRVFASILGHYTWTFDDPLFRVLVLRGICWTAGEPADRLSGLATVGARVKE